jgi:hypothetical protein
MLLEEFNRILFETADSGRKVLVFIDEGNSIKVQNLEALRLLTNMQEDTRNLFTLVLAGQPRLGRMLEAPERANLFQRIGVYAKLEPLESTEVVKDYIEHRMERAGRTEPIFTNGAYSVIFEHSQGTPRLINRVCKLALKAGETHGFRELDADLVREIAARFEPEHRAGKTARTAEQKSLNRMDAEHTVAAAPARPDPNVGQAGTVSDSRAGKGNGEPKPARGPVGDEYKQAAAPVGSERQMPVWRLPPEILERVSQLPDQESRLRFAGQLAAKEIQEHPEKFATFQGDPIQIWDKLRSEIMNSFTSFPSNFSY